MTVPSTVRSVISRGMGCRAFSWRGREIALLCFTLEDGRPAHFFVMDARDLPDSDEMGRARMARHGDWVTTTWVEGGAAFVLATGGVPPHKFPVL
jgi:hypothetical protein